METSREISSSAWTWAFPKVNKQTNKRSAFQTIEHHITPKCEKLGPMLLWKFNIPDPDQCTVLPQQNNSTQYCRGGFLCLRNEKKKLDSLSKIPRRTLDCHEPAAGLTKKKKKMSEVVWADFSCLDHGSDKYTTVMVPLSVWRMNERCWIGGSCPILCDHGMLRLWRIKNKNNSSFSGIQWQSFFENQKIHDAWQASILHAR